MTEIPLLKKVQKVMTKDVLTVKPYQSLTEAAKIMRLRKVGSLIVVDREKKIVGIITERDFLKFVAGRYDCISLAVGEAMTKRVVTCTPDITVEAALRLMNKKQVRHLPVVKDGELAGILSIRDVSSGHPALPS